MQVGLSVELISFTPDPESLVAEAARLCYKKEGMSLTSGARNLNEDAKLLEDLFKAGHLSPFEHASFTFYVEGVSRALSHQLVRHRIASYTQRSQRYIKEDNFDYVVPEYIDKDPELKNIFIDSMEYAQEKYKHLISLGVKPEDARFVLPNACATKLIITMNARALFNFFKERLCKRAQWEIRNLAEEMYNLVYNVAPNIFKFAGPDCKLGDCKQGSRSCKKEGK